jgi:hypothetical protein
MASEDKSPLPIIQYHVLKSRGSEQEVEVEKLLEVAQRLGFFYLDLRSTSLSAAGSPILEIKSRLCEFVKELFDLSAAEKAQYSVETNGGYFG